ncbi:hypothetical protein [Ramlibacter sp.]|uniref:hypothetical protein n=1 Tax=Ramlibacter sp. TaxID=1917967 RepID=UPI002C4B90B5|nr:hypothetical protein [Ramlibacter sp.]HWI80809.1 hypothetical protein [Ramlibacter sp.]
MLHHVAATRLPGLEASQPSLDASDEFELDDSKRYCPTRLLAAFALLMAGHGRCVSTSMMLGDREYAMWQLARAHTLHDPELREVAARLFAYFDDSQAPVPSGMRA